MLKLSLPILLFIISSATASDEIKLLWNERAPYMSYSNNELKGITGSVAFKVFNSSNIPYKLSKVTSKRQLLSIKSNKEKVCAIGWYKIKEREKFARFTKPIYKESPVIVLARSDNKKFKKHHTLNSILKSRDLSLLIKHGYSYGADLDKKILSSRNKIVQSYSSNERMFFLLAMKKVDYIFVAPIEANSLIKKSKHKSELFSLIKFKALTLSNNRYIICSKKVPESIIAQLNKHIPRI